MNIRNRWALVFLIVALASMAAAQTGVRRGPIVRQVDRILIESGTPGALFEFFIEDLQLPEAWPVADSGGYVSGGVSAGNVTLEVYRYARRNGTLNPQSSTARFSGLALEPHLIADALREMKASGIEYASPQPAVSILPDGTKGVAWTTVPLPSFSKAGLSIFLYEYSQAFLKADVRRKQLGNRLTLNRGGPLGIQSVREIVLSSTNFKQGVAAWQNLLGAQTASGHWNLGTGPSLRLVPGSRDGIEMIVIQIRSLAQAKAFLKNKDLLGPTSLGKITIKPSRIQGLSISLVE